MAVAGATPWAVWAKLLAASSAGLWAERTRVGAALSAPIVTMGLSLALANIGALPPASSAYRAINAGLVPLAVPCLLFDADLARAARDGGRLLACFAVGSAATVVGTLVAALLVPLKALGPDAWRVAAALAARHIGGAVNYVAVAEELGLAPATVTAGIAADNVVTAAYFGLLFYLATPGPAEPETAAAGAAAGADGAPAGEAGAATRAISPLGASAALALGCAVCAAGDAARAAGLALGLIPAATLVAVAGASAPPTRRYFRRAASAGSALGVLFMQLFFAATGAVGSIGAVARTAPALFAFSLVQLATHLGMLLLVGERVLGLPRDELLLASNANVGGPTTAAAMAAAQRWRALVVPALLTGVLGYSIATFVALALGHGALARIM